MVQRKVSRYRTSAEVHRRRLPGGDQNSTTSTGLSKTNSSNGSPEEFKARRRLGDQKRSIPRRHGRRTYKSAWSQYHVPTATYHTHTLVLYLELSLKLSRQAHCLSMTAALYGGHSANFDYTALKSTRNNSVRFEMSRRKLVYE